MRANRIIMVIAGLLLPVAVLAADAVEPATNSVTNVRGESIAALSGTYYTTTSLLLTNNLCLVGVTGSNTQGLDGVTVEITVGNSVSNNAYTATTYAVSGLTNRWWASVVIPDITGTCYVQTKLTDATTNIFIYPWKTLNLKDAL